MVITNYINLLKNPEETEDKDTFELKSIIDEYPYFQSARALYLKTLKKQESFKYNNQLKITAAYTTDRTILFNFISDKKKKKITEGLPIIETTEELSIEKELIITPALEVEEILNIDKPLSFPQNDTHSFNQWLQLASKTPIVREVVVAKKTKKDSIIDKFITTNPKIARISKTTPSVIKPVKTTQQHSQLMTETLAKVYLAQKKFDNAIKAYEILSLKYPEKSGFFADQIKRIQIIQNNK